MAAVLTLRRVHHPSAMSITLLRTLATLVLLGSFASILVQAQAEEPRVTLPTPDEAISGSVSNSATTVPAPEAPAQSQPSSSSSLPSAAPTTTSVTTTVVSIFYLNIRADGDEERGAPYTLFHRDTGEVIGVDESATTFIVTGILTDVRAATAKPKANDASSTSTGSSTTRASLPFRGNRTAPPSTITQGASTFLFTGTNYGPDRTLVNQCKLAGTTSASCSLTHLGKGWYTRKSPDFSGAWSTYNYTWTSGDRFGFAPVTITRGAERLPGPTPPASTSSGAGGMPTGVMLEEAYWLAWTATVLGSLIVGIFAVL